MMLSILKCRTLRSSELVGSYLTAFSLCSFCICFNFAEPASASTNDQWSAEVVIAEDFVSPPSRQVWVENPARGKRFELLTDKSTGRRQSEKFNDIKTGDQLELKFRDVPGRGNGRLLVRDIPQSENEVAIEALVPGSGESEGGSSTSAAVAVQRSVIALVVTWPGYSVPSTSAVDVSVFSGTSSSAKVVEDSSYSAIGYNPDRNGDGIRDVYGPYSVAKPTDPCDWSQFLAMATQVDNLARAQGIDPSQWQHRAYFLPAEMSCGFAGRAHIGCTSGSCHSQYDSDYLSWNDLVPHELGHNHSLHHASTDSDDNGTLDSEYADHSCHMGNPNNVVANNAPHRLQKGWLTSAQTLDASGAGTYRIAALDILPGTTADKHVLRIPVGSEYYYLSFRRVQAGTFDANLGSAYYNRVQIHRHSGGASQTRLIGTLAAGQSRTLQTGHLVQVTAVGADFAQIAVNGNCVRQAPALSLSPSGRTTNQVGSSQLYSVTIANRDGSFCSGSQFNLSGSVPAGWGITFDSASLNLGAGQSGSTNVYVTSAVGTADGNYVFRVNGQNSGDAVQNGFVDGAYTIDTIPPSAPSNLSVVLGRKNAVDLSWNASTGTNSYRVYRNGALISTVLSNSYKDGGLGACATYQYYVVALDLAGNASAASNTASITIACKGKGR